MLRSIGTRKTALGWDGFAEHLSNWRSPRQRPSVHELLSPKMITACIAAETYKCTASEGLTVYPIALHYFCTVVLPLRPDLAAPIMAYMLLCDVLDLLVECKNGRPCSAEKLHSAIVAWMAAHFAYYGEAHWVPKHHYCMHLARLLKRFGCLPACWTQERHHRIIKRFIEDFYTKRTMEYGLCVKLLVERLHDNTTALVLDGLCESHPAPQTMVDALRKAFTNIGGLISSASSARSDSMIFCRRDIILARLADGAVHAGMIWFFFSRSRIWQRCMFFALQVY